MGRPRTVAQRENRAGQRQFRRELVQRDAATTQRLVRAYATVERRIAKPLDALDAAAQDMTSPRELHASPAMLRLQDEVRVALNDFSKVIKAEASKGQQAGITAGREAGIAQLDTVATAFNRPSVETVQMLVNYVDSAAFQQTLADYGGYHAQHISDIVLTDSTMGKGVQSIVRHIRRYVDMPRYDAERMVRTVTLWSARRASHQIYQQNSDIVSGWRWSATLDRRTCMSCVVMHGRTFPNNQTLNDHHQGRCAAVPITRFTGGVKPGVEWFNDLTPTEQQDMMGRSAYRAWRDGAINLDQLSTEHVDPVYGPMRGEASLTSLIGAEAAGAYAA